MRRAARASALRFHFGKSSMLDAGALVTSASSNPRATIRSTRSSDVGFFRAHLRVSGRGRRCVPGDFVTLQLSGSFSAREGVARPNGDHERVDNRPAPRTRVARFPTPRRRCRESAPPAPGRSQCAASRTPGCCFSTLSTSSGKTLRPSGVTIISFLRPRIESSPLPFNSPISPV